MGQQSLLEALANIKQESPSVDSNQDSEDMPSVKCEEKLPFSSLKTEGDEPPKLEKEEPMDIKPDVKEESNDSKKSSESKKSSKSKKGAAEKDDKSKIKKESSEEKENKEEAMEQDSDDDKTDVEKEE